MSLQATPKKSVKTRNEKTSEATKSLLERKYKSSQHKNKKERAIEMATISSLFTNVAVLSEYRHTSAKINSNSKQINKKSKATPKETKKIYRRKPQSIMEEKNSRFTNTWSSFLLLLYRFYSFSPESNIFFHPRVVVYLYCFLKPESCPQQST